jgi:transcriptional antiterminator RfaH
MLRWYLIHTKPSGESIARWNLERQGYEVYFPRLLQPVPRRGRGRCRDAIVPLFPRYLGLRLSEGLQSLAPVRSTLGVVNAVRFGSSCAVGPDQIIGDLRLREDPVSGLHRLNPNSRLTPGARVRITTGPFSGLEGVFERQAGPERVIVRLKVLGHDAPVRVPMGFVVPGLAV